MRPSPHLDVAMTAVQEELMNPTETAFREGDVMRLACMHEGQRIARAG